MKLYKRADFLFVGLNILKNVSITQRMQLEYN